jgi:hypothetical protein
MIQNGLSPQLPLDPAEALAHLRARDATLGALPSGCFPEAAAPR